MSRSDSSRSDRAAAALLFSAFPLAACGSTGYDEDAGGGAGAGGLDTEGFRTFGSPEHEESRALAVLDGGALVFAGGTKGAGAGAEDALVVRVDGGEVAWARTFGGPENDLAVATVPGPSGSVHVVASVTSEPEVGDAVVATFGLGGDLLASRSYGSEEHDLPRAAAARPDGGLWVVLETYGYGPGAPEVHAPWALGLDEAGSVVSSVVYAGGEDGDAFFAVAPDPSTGGLVFAGGVENEGAGSDDAWLLAVGADGAPLWSVAYGTEEDEELRALARAPDGSWLGVGTAVDPDEERFVLLVRTTSTGDLVQARVCSGTGLEEGRAVAFSGDRFRVAGFGPGDGGADAFLLDVPAAGEPEALRLLAGAEGDLLYAIAVDGSGALAGAGHTSSRGAGKGELLLVPDLLAGCPLVPDPGPPDCEPIDLQILAFEAAVSTGGGAHEVPVTHALWPSPPPLDAAGCPFP